MDDLIRRSDAIKALGERPEVWMDMPEEIQADNDWVYHKTAIEAIPAVEPNLVLPERMERGEVYDVGETITVMNHEDYMDMTCKAMMWDEYGEEPKHGEWIPCEERLPEDIRPVLVTWKNNDPKSYYQYIVGKHFIGTAHYHRGKWYWYSSVTEDLLAEYGKCDGEEFDEAIEVVAWMPLPEPYTKGVDE